MLCPKSLDTANLFILNLDSRIRLAHQRVSQEIDTMPDMRSGRHHWQVVLHDGTTFYRCLIDHPETLPDTVLQRLSLKDQNLTRLGLLPSNAIDGTPKKPISAVRLWDA